MARRERLRERWHHMSPEERDQMHSRMRERWQNLPPEERDARRRELRERWERMTPEERRQMRRDMEEPMGPGHGMGMHRGMEQGGPR